ncbi:MAG: peptidoglycan-binding protein [Anaerolineae bacterium]|nr:peptidoglycan-binding protein [Anaerolineae bacterium]
MPPSMLSSLNPLKKVMPAGALPVSQQRAKIVTVDADGNPLPTSDKRRVELEFQFNPAQLSITKKVKWNAGKLPPARNAPDLDFGGGESATFSLALIFDTTRESSRDARDVRKYTQELLALVMVYGAIEERKPPPRVRFQWGKFVLFLAVVQEVSVSYTLFDPDGTPVRAEATVKFVQQDDSDDFLRGQNPTTRTEARKTRVVEQGERLDLIAFQEYGSAANWRFLADVNGLTDPRTLEPGMILLIPPLP